MTSNLEAVKEEVKNDLLQLISYVYDAHESPHSYSSLLSESEARIKSSLDRIAAVQREEDARICETKKNFTRMPSFIEEANQAMDVWDACCNFLATAIRTNTPKI